MINSSRGGGVVGGNAGKGFGEEVTSESFTYEHDFILGSGSSMTKA